MIPDPLCPATQHFEVWKEDCCCEVLAEARADEREKATQRILASYWKATDGVAKITLDDAIAAARGEDKE